jgi:hypothetical protein
LGETPLPVAIGKDNGGVTHELLFASARIEIDAEFNPTWPP